MRLGLVFLALFACSSRAPAGQGPGPQQVTVIEYLQGSFTALSAQILAAAERMPAADYGFKPSQMAEARTYGAVIGHVTDGMFGACARTRGVPNPQPEIEHTRREKSELVDALTRSIAFCEEAFAALTESNAQELVPQGPMRVPRLAALMGVLAHDAEMFGISTVYLRARHIVPPGSEPRR